MFKNLPTAVSIMRIVTFRGLALATQRRVYPGVCFGDLQCVGLISIRRITIIIAGAFVS